MEGRSWNCYYCPREYPRWADLRGHLIMNHGYQPETLNPFACGECGWSYDNEAEFLAHRRSRHDIIVVEDRNRGLSDPILDAVHKPKGVNDVYHCSVCGRDTCICGAMKVSDVCPGMKHLTLVGSIVDFSAPHEIDTKYGRTLLARGFLEDATGRIRLCFWGDHARNVIADRTVRIENAFARDFQNEVEVNVGWRARLIAKA